MVDSHGEKTTNHFDQCGSHGDKNTLYFGGLSQITDTISRFWSMNEMFCVSNYILQTCNTVLKCAKAIEKTVITVKTNHINYTLISFNKNEIE